MGGNAISPDITNIKQEYNSFREVFEEALEQEISVTQSIKNIAARCHKEQDYVTLEFLNWFFKEQREEEYKARRALELFDVIGEEGLQAGEGPGVGGRMVEGDVGHVTVIFEPDPCHCVVLVKKTAP